MDITAEMDAARAEQSSEPRDLEIRGEKYVLPGGPLPWDVQLEFARFSKEQSSSLQAEQAGAIIALDKSLQVLFGAEQYERVRAQITTSAEFMVVLNSISELYGGVTAGESGGSAGNSRSIGARRKPISNVSMGSTSAGPASGNGNA